MSSHRLEDTMNQVFQGRLPLSTAQKQRLASASSALTLAGSVQLPLLANWLPRGGQKAGRVRFLERFFEAEFLCQELVYQPLLRHFLARRRDAVWYVLIDRSTLRGYETEVLVISLANAGHAIPLVWQVIDFGCTGADEQLELWHRLVRLLKQILPSGTRLVVQGDTEFGSVKVIQFLCAQAWQFILAQPANTRYRPPHSPTWQVLSDLPLKSGKGIYLEQVEWTEQHQYGTFNLFAFWQPHQASPESQRREARYCLTNLRMSHMLRPLGRRRWGIECFFKDYKSGGFAVEDSHFRRHERWEKLLVLLAVNYLWFNSVGRWLSKVGQRALVDARQPRQLNFFRIGWDWIIAEFIQGNPIPPIATLYS
jgi:hypothetical protein